MHVPPYSDSIWLGKILDCARADRLAGIVPADQVMPDGTTGPDDDDDDDEEDDDDDDEDADDE